MKTQKAPKQRRAVPTAKPKGDQDRLAAEKLEASGLGSVADRLGAKALTKEGCQLRLGGMNWPPSPGGLELPYFDQNGEPTGFFRIRLLGPVESGLFGAEPDMKKVGKYRNLPDTGVNLYWPPLLDGTWREYLDRRNDEDRPLRLVITEGELKAACATLNGVPTVGLGGVDMATVDGELHPDLAAICEGREIIIAFDSDAPLKGGVLQAETKLASMLLDRGADVSIARLPELDGMEKVGLDDLVVAKGPEALVAVIDEAEEYAKQRVLREMNLRFAVVDELDSVLCLETGRIKSWHNFEMGNKDLAYMEHGQDKEGRPTSKKTEATKAWLAWPEHLRLDRIDYRPGEARILGDTFNLWNGWGCEPKAGDLRPWRWLIDEQLFKGEPELARWFEGWLAWPLQNPGGKLHTCAVLWSQVHGVGKNMMAEVVARIYGVKTRVTPWGNCSTIGDKDLESHFTASWARNVCFVIGNEISSGDNRPVAARLKSLVADEVIPIEEKNQPRYDLTNRINFLLLSNENDALFLQRHDRRYFVHEVDASAMDQDKAMWLRAWKNEDGPAALFHHLLNLDISWFSPWASAPMTKSKRDMIEAGMGELDLWIEKLRESPEAALGKAETKAGTAAAECALFTGRELTAFCNAYRTDGTKAFTESSVGKALKRGGFHKFGAQVKVGEEVRQFWVVRDFEKWRLDGLSDAQRRAKVDEARKHWSQHMGGRP